MTATRRLYLRLLAVVYLCAFASLAVQISGLIGSQGVAPAAEWLAAVRAQTGAERYWLAPTLLWLNASDTSLHLVCALGIAAALLVFFEVAAAPALAGAWLAYLSLSVVGQEFLSFQWDGLLLEAGFLSIFLAAPVLSGRAAAASPVPGISVWLLRVLLFRLMFCSGVVKLGSGDPTWRALTALQFHYETQPLPNPLAWYVHHLPSWAHALAALQMFGIELLVPFLIFAPRRLRLAAAAVLACLQLAIALSGNYAFFNLLAIALCLLLLDDAALPAPLRGEAASADAGAPSRVWPKPLLIALAAGLGLLATIQTAATFRLGRWIPRPLALFYSWASPLQVVNGYGLFAVMTTTRDEIVVEGSDDGTTWRAYEFRYKPGDLRRAPPVVAPHQPRLDWQMWFAALGRWEQNRWFLGLERRLLEASPPVLALLAHDPFEGRPPRFVRARLFQYRFTTPEGGRGGDWWTREDRGPYGPVVTRP